MEPPAVLAIAAHPDDIEFGMAGTLLLLKQRGWALHCFNVSTGSLGSSTMTMEQTRTARRAEAQAAAAVLGATWHAPIADDLEITYDLALLRKVAAVVRDVRPSVILTHALADYMEDHTATARLAVSGAFVRGVPNYVTDPPIPPVAGDVTIYHAMPHTLCDPLGVRVRPEAWVDISSVLEVKKTALACHASQREWLDATQGMDSYVQTMVDLCEDLGRESGQFPVAEGWRRHNWAGFCARGADPLAAALGPHFLKNAHYPA